MKLIFTNDGSHTIINQQINESYHSKNGAVNESQHVYIKHGLSLIEKSEINILEIGFGTGLNALLTYQYAIENNKRINYFAIEKYPLNIELVTQLNYPSEIKTKPKVLHNLHTCQWNNTHLLYPNFNLKKYHADLTNFNFSELKNIDLVYFDAFSPAKQPELWTENIFKQIYDVMSIGSLLTTYSSAGMVKRALRNTGFKVKRKPGPKGKFHILNATKMAKEL